MKCIDYFLLAKLTDTVKVSLRRKIVDSILNAKEQTLIDEPKWYDNNNSIIAFLTMAEICRFWGTVCPR